MDALMATGDYGCYSCSLDQLPLKLLYAISFNPKVNHPETLSLRVVCNQVTLIVVKTGHRLIGMSTAVHMTGIFATEQCPALCCV